MFKHGVVPTSYLLDWLWLLGGPSISCIRIWSLHLSHHHMRSQGQLWNISEKGCHQKKFAFSSDMGSPSIHPSFNHIETVNEMVSPSIHSSTHPSVHLSTHRSTHAPVHVPIHSSKCPPTPLFSHASAHPRIPSDNYLLDVSQVSSRVSNDA